MVSSRSYTERNPTFTPLPYGLLDSVEVITDTDKEWRNGIEFQPDICEDALTIQVVCVTGDGATKAASATDIPVRGAETFAVYAYIPCSPVGWGDNLERYQQMVRTALENGRSRGVERLFWTGTADDASIYNPHLAEDAAVVDGEVILQTAATVVTGGDVTDSVSALEGAMADCYGGVPTIHVPREALAPMAEKTQIVERGGKLYTMGGSLVVAGAGYAGTSPAGAAPAAGSAWFYATGSVLVRQSEVMFFDPIPRNSVDKEKNTVIMVAEQFFSVAWDCCHFGALTTLTN